MTQDFVIGTAAYVFLAGVLMLALSLIPAARRRVPRLMLYGFAVAVLSFVLVLLAGLLPG